MARGYCSAYLERIGQIIHLPEYKRGIGYYRLAFDTPANVSGQRYWLQFDAVSLVSDVWLNGKHLGKHKGGFTVFRYDATDALDPKGKNVLVVKADNSVQKPGSTTEDVPTYSSDFMIQGGIYRDVKLFATSNTHIDTMDADGPGVYATTKSAGADSAELAIRSQIATSEKADRPIKVKTVLTDSTNKVVATEATQTNTAGSSVVKLEQALRINRPRLWHRKVDPYLYTLSAEVNSQDGKLLDRVSFPYGIRTFKVDFDKGFILNGKPYPLHGVATHQDFYGKGWATTKKEKDINWSQIIEIGANTVRFSHYPYAQYDYEMADKLGMVVYTDLAWIIHRGG